MSSPADGSLAETAKINHKKGAWKFGALKIFTLRVMQVNFRISLLKKMNRKLNVYFVEKYGCPEVWVMAVLMKV